MKVKDKLKQSIKTVFRYGSKDIHYYLTFQKRKSLGVRVHPDASIEVIAPLLTSEEKVTEKLRSKAPWILKQQREFLSYQFHASAKQYLSGETHLYLGRQYRLKVNEGGLSSSKMGEVKLTCGHIQIELGLNHGSTVRGALEEWYRERAIYWFDKILADCILHFQKREKLPFKEIDVEIRKMEKRWGSCTQEGRIFLNPDLIRAAKSCIEYVIIHELCHLIHHNHTRDFYDLQDKILPDWEQRKRRLEYSML